MSSRHWLAAKPLDAHAFSPFGDVIQLGQAGKHRTINDHPLIALDAGGDFLVIDRGGPGAAEDCEEHSLLEGDVLARE